MRSFVVLVLLVGKCMGLKKDDHHHLDRQHGLSCITWLFFWVNIELHKPLIWTASMISLCHMTNYSVLTLAA